MAPSRSRASVRSLFASSSYDADADAYTSVGGASDSEPDSDSAGDDVLREEEEREKLLAGGLLGSLTRSGSIKIGKKVRRGARRAAGDVASMMGGKRLGMEEGGEFGLDLGDESGDDDVPEKKPRKPTLRGIIFFTSTLGAFLMVLVFASLALSRGARSRGPALVLSNGTHAYAATTLLISLDGVRGDFLGGGQMPALAKFAAEGVRAEYMIPSFPTVTFPNHWTLATGLLPAAHGIVGNSFYDPELGKSFYYTDPARSLQGEWWGGEPVWMTAERQGLRAAVHMWPGSEARGWGAETVDAFNSTETLERKAGRILDWLDLPAGERPHLLAAYVPDVDISGHRYGPNTTETNTTLTQVDTMLATLFSGLDARNLTDIVNVMIVSDHGMATTSKTRLIYIDDLLNTTAPPSPEGWPLYGLRPDNVTETYTHLKSLERADSHWRVFRDLPARYHFSGNPRIAPLWIIPDAGWTVVTRSEFPPGTPGEYHPRGLHGFDNTHPLMRAVFAARGPAFAEVAGETVAPFANTEVYRMVCQSLGIDEAASNATADGIAGLMKLSEAGASLTPPEPTSLTPQSTASAPPPPRPTKIADPVASGTIEVSPPAGAEEQAEGEAEGSWWELLKHKVDRLKGKLEGWWDTVWVPVDGEGTDEDGA